MQLNNIIDLEKLEFHISNGNISKRKHPTLPLYVLNYTHRCQYANDWTDETIFTRGLIVDEDWNIVGRSFKKFFAPEQHDALELPSYPWDDQYIITEKVDGVLFIVTNYMGQVVTATRGSFESDYVPVGNAILRDKYNDFKFDPTKTYVFELISPETHIVVNYGDRRDIILLSVIDTETGSERFQDVLELSDVFPIPKVYPSNTPSSELEKLFPDDGTTEGLVVHFSDGQRAKYKGLEYKRWHRILTNTNTITIWEYMTVEDIRKDYNDPKRVAQYAQLDPKDVTAMLAHDNLFDAILDRTPDEWYKFVDDTRRILIERFKSIEDRALTMYELVDSMKDRKQKAIKIMSFDSPYRDICMNIMNNKPYRHIIWKVIRPKYGKPFVQDSI